MNSPGSRKDASPLDTLPRELADAIVAHVEPARVSAAAMHDLDSRGMFTEACLVLTDAELGCFTRRDGRWAGEWRALSGFTGAVFVEGLRMSLLRIVSGGTVAGEYRFSMKHIREGAGLHRKLERHFKGKEAEPEAESRRGPKLADERRRCDKCGQVIPAWSEVCPICVSRRKVLVRLLDFVRPYKWRALTGFVLALLVTLSGLVRPYLTRPMIDVGLGVAPGHTADYGVLLRYVLLMAGLTVFSAVAGSVRERLMATLGSRLSRDIRDKVYAHLHKLSLSFFAKKPTGSLVARVTSDSDRIWDFVAFTIIEITISFMTIIGVGVALFTLNARLAGIVLLPVPLMFFLTTVFHRKLHGGFDRLFHRWSVLTSVVSDALPGVRVIKAFSQERREVERFERKNNEFYDGEVEMITLWTFFGPVMQFCSQVGSLLVWIVGGYWVVKGQMTAGTLMAYVGYMWMFYEPIHMVAHMDRMFNRAASSVQRIFEVLDTEPAIFSSAAAVPASQLKGEIRLENVSFSYDGVRRVLNDVNLVVEPGTMIGLAGPSGGGKTTLVNLICRFYDALEGRILIDGVDVRDYDVEAMRRHIGVVLQEPFLFHDTVAGNIAYGKPDATLDEIIEAARSANAHDFIVRFPDGYDTLVGERGQTLSAGERQRISIARAILSNPTILILDEATSSVDTETEKLIQEALDRLTARRTTIAIAHRLSTLRKAGRLVIVDKGRIVEEGPHDQLLNKEDGLYARLVRMQKEMQSLMALG